MDDRLPLQPPPDPVKPKKPTKPLTRGRRIARWFGRISGLLLLIALLAHSGWTWKSGYDLQKRITELSAAGEPMTISDLQPKPIDPAENASVELSQLGAILKYDTPAGKALTERVIPFALPLADSERAMIQAWTGENQEVLRLIEQAAKKPKAQVTDPLKSPLLVKSLGSLKHDRTAARLLKHQALLDMDADRHDQAIARLTEMEVVARSAGSQPFLVASLVGTGVRAMQAEMLCDIAPRLKIGTTSGDASPDSVRKLIAMLLDSSAIQQQQLNGLRGERLSMRDTFQCIEDGTPMAWDDRSEPTAWPLVSRYLAKPYLRSNSVWCIDAMTALISTIDAADVPAFRQKYAPVAARIDQERRSPLRTMSSMLMPKLDRAIESTYRLRTERHLAATALAIRIHESEHGQRPPSLDALVPAYIPGVPADLLTSASPIRYQPLGDRPLLWSVGVNGTDDSGDFTLREPSAGPWTAPDRVVFLTPQPRAAPTTQEAR